MKGRKQVKVLNDPLASRWSFRGRHGLAGNIKIERPSDVRSIGACKQTERTTNSGINIQDLILSVPPIIPVSNIEDSAVSDRLHEPGRCLFHFFVGKTNSEAGNAGGGRKPADLLTG